jgi:peptide/nickel transport system permease protein
VGRYLVQRAATTVLVTFLAASAVFLLLHLTGDPTLLMVPMDASRQLIAEVRHAYGFDQPLPVQYLRYIGRVLQGDFGQSLRQPVPALRLVLAAAPNSLILAVASLLLAVGLGVPLGVLAAQRPGSLLDRLAVGWAVTLQSVPDFWLGLVLIILLAVRHRVFPTGGFTAWRSLVLPTLTLAAYSLGNVTRLTRAGYVAELGRDYVRTARGKGLAERVVQGRHVLRNAAIPLVTIVALQFGALFGGAVVTETVFDWPGLGRLLADAIAFRDFPVVTAAVTVIAAGVSAANLLADVAYALIHPVIRVAR